jgi:hypothetical protein
MLDFWHRYASIRILALAVFLPLLYICQIVPHQHADFGHTDHAKTPGAHTHHSHSHDEHHHDHDKADPQGSAHHHEFAQHLDSHSLRGPTKEMRNTHAVECRVVEHYTAVDSPPRAHRSGIDPRVPDRIPTEPIARRGPPALA